MGEDSISAVIKDSLIFIVNPSVRWVTMSGGVSKADLKGVSMMAIMASYKKKAGIMAMIMAMMLVMTRFLISLKCAMSDCVCSDITV